MNNVLTIARNALVSVQEARLINDPSINETPATEQEAVAGTAKRPCIEKRTPPKRW